MGVCYIIKNHKENRLVYESMLSKVYFELSYDSYNDTYMHSVDVDAMEVELAAAKEWGLEQQAMGPRGPEDLGSVFSA